MTLQWIRQFLASYEHVSFRTLDVYNVMKAYILMRPQRPSEKIIDVLRKDLHPDLFYHPKLSIGPKKHTAF